MVVIDEHEHEDGGAMSAVGGAGPVQDRTAGRVPAIPLRADGSVSYANRIPHRSRRFTVPLLIVTIGVAAGTAATLLIELL